MSKRIGDEIRDIVQNAVNTMDFHQLNRDIGNTVNSALDEVRSALGRNPRNKSNWNNPNDNYGNWDNDRGNYNSWNTHDNRQGQSHRQSNNNEHVNNWNRYRNNQTHTYSTGNYTKVSKPQAKQQNALIPNIPLGRISGILLTVFGSIGIGTIGIAAIVLCLIGQLTGNLSFFGTIAIGLLPLFFASLYMSSRGSHIRKRLKRFYRYLDVIKNRSYCTMKELTESTGLNKKFVLKDLRKMITIGMFPEGHIDEQETCLILNRESYNQYLELQKNIRMQNFKDQDKSEDRQQNMQGSTKTPSTDPATDAELRNAIEAGRACIRQIKEANDAIPGEEISKKLYRLEIIIEKIFNYVELHPAQLTEIQKFMDYYLPTTLKLVNTYKEFDIQIVQGENIKTAKNEIESTLDTINLAFEKLFDSLFMNAAMDVSTDISVLETLLAQEGLTQKDFKSNNGRINR